MGQGEGEMWKELWLRDWMLGGKKCRWQHARSGKKRNLTDAIMCSPSVIYIQIVSCAHPLLYIYRSYHVRTHCYLYTDRIMCVPTVIYLCL